MIDRQNRYKQMELLLGGVVGADILLFIIYWIAAGSAIIWLKAVSAVLIVLLSLACIGYLYMTKELLKRRSLWIGLAAAAIVVCTLLSLILRFPSPNPLKAAEIIKTIL